MADHILVSQLNFHTSPGSLKQHRMMGFAPHERCPMESGNMIQRIQSHSYLRPQGGGDMVFQNTVPFNTGCNMIGNCFELWEPDATRRSLQSNL